MTVEYTFGYIDNFEPSESFPQVTKTTHLNFKTGDTWVNVVEHFLIFLEEVYDYEIRPHVYYSVALPTNNEIVTKAVGREMSQEVFDKLADKHQEELFPYHSFDYNEDDDYLDFQVKVDTSDTTEEDKDDENTRNS